MSRSPSFGDLQVLREVCAEFEKKIPESRLDEYLVVHRFSKHLADEVVHDQLATFLNRQGAKAGRGARLEWLPRVALLVKADEPWGTPLDCVWREQLPRRPIFACRMLPRSVRRTYIQHR